VSSERRSALAAGVHHFLALIGLRPGGVTPRGVTPRVLSVRIFSGLLVAATCIATSLPAQVPNPAPDTIWVSDRFFFDSTTTGARILAKFRTADARTSLLALDGPVTTIDGRRWTIGDILVRLDLNGNGFVAMWTVAGPRRVVETHLARVRELAENRRIIYDHDIRLMLVRCACD
jgi:hypothetical protein